MLCSPVGLRRIETTKGIGIWGESRKWVIVDDEKRISRLNGLSTHESDANQKTEHRTLSSLLPSNAPRSRKDSDDFSF